MSSRWISGRPNYDKSPFVEVPGAVCDQGWDAIGMRLVSALAACDAPRPVVAVECYPGVDEQQVLRELGARLSPSVVIHAKEAMLQPADIDRLAEPFLGGDDPIFGFLCHLTLDRFFDPGKLTLLRARIAQQEGHHSVRLVVGAGAALIAPEADILIYADLTRWEAQLRFRRNETSNLGVENAGLSAGLQYKRAFFVDWRVADRFKKPLLKTCDFVIDTNAASAPKLVTGDAVRDGFRRATTRPFRVVPFFDPGPWGGQWMKEVCDLDPSEPNYAWCFDCVPEENSLLLKMGGTLVELPSIDLVFQHPRDLLGTAVYGRFGDEFPIRFDFLDTMDGGNLSLQVHPLTEYIQEKFGIRYTQDESYYMLEAGEDAKVYLGLKDGVDPEAMIRELEASQTTGQFDANRHVGVYPVKKHDHVLIPAGTVHCSGKNSMVLEISATPYIFTFKLWDWNRLGMDGKPRPINIGHGSNVIQWERTESWVKANLVNQVTVVAEGDGWVEERTGLHEQEFIETRRHWFTKPVTHHTNGGVNVLNLVEGREAVVESPAGAFEPFVVHYAETFIVPAAVGAYTIRPHGESEGKRCGTVKAFVRCKP